MNLQTVEEEDKLNRIVKKMKELKKPAKIDEIHALTYKEAKFLLKLLYIEVD